MSCPPARRWRRRQQHPVGFTQPVSRTPSMSLSKPAPPPASVSHPARSDLGLSAVRISEAGRQVTNTAPTSPAAVLLIVGDVEPRADGRRHLDDMLLELQPGEAVDMADGLRAVAVLPLGARQADILRALERCGYEVCGEAAAS